MTLGNVNMKAGVVVVHSDEQGFIAVRDGEKGTESVYNS